MFSASTLPLALLATLSTVTASSFNSPHGGHAIRRAPSHHWSRSNLPGRVNSSRPRMARRGSSDEPSTLSEGSLTAAEGCTQWYHVAAGDSCYSAIATVTGGLALEDFYSMNPQINEDCFNLWAGFDYCVARTTTSSSSSATSSKAVANNAVVHAVQTTSSQTTTTAAASSTASAEDDDEDCDADDEEYASTSAPVRAAVAQTTTAAPATSTDDSAAKAAASKSSADAAWASSSKSSADAAWASSSKAAADAAWASSSKAAVAAVQTTTAAAETTKVADLGGANSKLSAMGISTFLGKQTGAIASWFHTNSATDSTNGNSWCYRPYDDSLPGFAPSLKTMTASFGGDAIAAGKAFCGLWADVTLADGTTSRLMIVDAFDDSWVLTPTSIDVVYGAFTKLWGSKTSNKNDVLQGVTWQLTGERNPDYVFNNGNPV